MQTQMIRVVVLTATFMLTPGCHREGGTQSVPDSKRIAVAKGQLESLISSGQGTGDNAYAEYMTRHAQQGLDVLKAGKVPTGPVPVSATITMTVARKGIGLWFFDPSFEVTGIVVETGSGEAKTFSSLFAWTPEDRKWYSETILRDCGVEIDLIDDEGRVIPSVHSNPYYPRIRLPKRFVEGPLRIRLLTQGGVRDGSVDVYVRHLTLANAGATTVPSGQ